MAGNSYQGGLNIGAYGVTNSNETVKITSQVSQPQMSDMYLNNDDADRVLHESPLQIQPEVDLRQFTNQSFKESELKIKESRISKYKIRRTEDKSKSTQGRPNQARISKDRYRVRDISPSIS